MKKISIITLLLILVLSAQVMAVETYGSITYNTYNLDDINDDAKRANVKEVDSGVGFNLGLKQRFSNTIKLGIQGDFLAAKWDSNDNYQAKTIGVLATVDYRLPKSWWGYDWDALGAAGMYFTTTNSDKVDNDDSDFGYKLGLKATNQVTSYSKYVSFINYRVSDVKVKDTTVDFSGFEIGVSYVRKF